MQFARITDRRWYHRTLWEHKGEFPQAHCTIAPTIVLSAPVVHTVSKGVDDADTDRSLDGSIWQFSYLESLYLRDSAQPRPTHWSRSSTGCSSRRRMAVWFSNT